MKSRFSGILPACCFCLCPLLARRKVLYSGKGGGILDTGGFAARAEAASALQRFLEPVSR